MLARAELPARFAEWNGRTGAPYHGPFAQYVFAPSTRVWEYPWAWFAAPHAPGTRALDIGGANSGFGILLAREGVELHVADPDRAGQAPPPVGTSWARLWGAEIQTHRCTTADVELPPGTVDVAYCLSVMEHIAEAAERVELMRAAHRLLRPGGHFVLTVDLCFAAHPFKAAATLGDVRNVSIADLVAAADFEVSTGDASELFGMPGFRADDIQRRARAGELLVTPAGIASQCFVLRRRP